MLTAIEFGKRYGSCDPAMEWRRSLGPAATQADAYLTCERADWLIWQLTRESSVYAKVTDEVLLIVNAMADEAVETHCLNCGVPAVEEWAALWLSGEDRSARAAAWVAAAAAEAEATAAWAWAEAAEAAANPIEWHENWCSWIRGLIPQWPDETGG